MCYRCVRVCGEGVDVWDDRAVVGSVEPLIFHVEAKLRDHRVDFHRLDRLEQRGDIDAIDDIFSLTEP